MGNILIQPSDYLDALPKQPIGLGEENFMDTFQYHPEITDLLVGRLKHSWNLFIQQSSAASTIYFDFIRRGDWISKSNVHASNVPVNLNGLRSLIFTPEGKSSVLAELDEKKPVSGASATHAGSNSAAESKTVGHAANISVNSQKTTVVDYCFVDNDTQPWLHIIIFPLFLQSEDYRKYLGSCLQDDEATEFLYQGEVQTLESLSIIFDQTNRVKDTLASGLSMIDYMEWKRLALHEYWLYQLVAYAEEFPYPVSVATARMERRGFPLIYVNKAFERMTLYERKEVIGKNCKFLQSHETENEKINKISEALRYAKAVKVIVTNQRQTGESFLNALAMKPIFDQNGVYSYNICVHADVSDYESISYNIGTMDYFLEMVPNILTANYY